MNFKIINLEEYYRKGVFNHFSKDAKCSISMTSRINVTELYKASKESQTKFYLNFLYVLSTALNRKEDYRMMYNWKTNEIYCFDEINPTQYVFHDDTKTCTPVYTKYYKDYKMFYENAQKDVEEAKKTREYLLDEANHPNWFDASFMPWVSYDSFNVELPDGYLYFQPIINWGKYRWESDQLMMPVTVRLNHAIGDGYLVSLVYLLIEEEMQKLVEKLRGAK